MLNDNRDIYLFAAVASMLISAWSVFADPIINQDGVQYLLAANDFSSGQFRAGISLFKWPTYAIAIAVVSKLTPFGIESSAHLLNALLFASLVCGFLFTVKKLGGTRSTLIFAAIILLLFPSLNKFRPFIIRDAGYLSFYIWALGFLFAHCQTRKLTPLIVAMVCLAIAGLFRVEAFAILAIVPIILLGIHAKSTWQKRWFWLAGAIAACLMCIGLALWVFGAESKIPFQTFKANPFDSTAQIVGHVWQQITFRLDTIRYEFLTEFSGDFAPTVLVLTLLIMVAYESLRRLAFIYAVLAWHAWYRRLVFQQASVRYFWQLLLLAHLVLLTAFTFSKMFIASRYTMALVLTVMVAVPFSVEHFYKRWQTRDRAKNIRFGFPLLVTVITLLGIDSLDLWTDKRYVRDAGQWVDTNSEPSARLYSNSHIVMHYAGRDALRSGRLFNWQETMFLAGGLEWRTYDYFALQFEIDYLDRKKRFEDTVGLLPAKVFANSDGDQVAVYQLPPYLRLEN
jgi:hypothetical protein